MKELLIEFRNRLLNILSAIPQDSLHYEEIQDDDAYRASKYSFLNLLIIGKKGGSSNPLALILISDPSNSADDESLLDLASRRSRAHKASYMVTWTLRDAILWMTPKPGIPPTREHLEKIKEYPRLYEIGLDIEELRVETIKIKIDDFGKLILSDLLKLDKDEALELIQLDATYFVERLLESIHKLLPLVSKSINLRLQDDHVFRNDILQWATKQSIPGSPPDYEFSESIARQTIYRLMGKILFYQSLRRSARQLPKLDLKEVDEAKILPTLWSAFSKALAIDYHAVFQEDIPDKIKWPREAAQELALLIEDFNKRDFSQLPQDVIGTVFERLIPPEERHLLGQYFTSEDLCDLIVAFCVRSPKDKVLDPTCGTGTFLIRAYEKLKSLGEHDHAKLLSQIWGIDVAPFPAELATINLYSRNLSEHQNFPRIICRDVFKIFPGETFPFPPPKADIEKPESIQELMPEFDAIIGNFPYVSGGDIENQEPGYLHALKDVLIKDWLQDYPKLFFYANNNAQSIYERSVANGKHTSTDLRDLRLRLSSYADLYVYLFIHTSRFLSEGGRIGIVTSNAWLDVSYGDILKSFILDNYKIIAILESRTEPWFVEASVNTIVTILEKCIDKTERDKNLVKFVKVKGKLRELIQGDSSIGKTIGYQQLQKYIDFIENAGNKYRKTFPIDMITEESEHFRIRIKRQVDLSVNENQYPKWGKYLRAPQVYFDLVKDNVLVSLSKHAIPCFGSKTRINEFFHLTGDKIESFKIEPDYIFPLLKSPKETNKIEIDLSGLKISIFVCRKSKKELKELGHVGALNYIKWGEQQKYEKGKFRGLAWPEGTWVKKRKPGWWALPDNEIKNAYIFSNEIFNEKHFFKTSHNPIIPDNVLCYYEPINPKKTRLLMAILNSSITSLCVEIAGRVALGDGALKLQIEDARDHLLIPNIDIISKDSASKIISLFDPILRRDIANILEELRKLDRKAFDREVLSSLGLNAKTYQSLIYSGLIELVTERIVLGELRAKERKTKTRKTKSEKKIFEDVVEDILPAGPRRFPDEFWTLKVAMIFPRFNGQ